jgi:hypothetical protein
LGGQPHLYRHRLLERYRFYHPVPKTKLASNAALGTEILQKTNPWAAAQGSGDEY